MKRFLSPNRLAVLSDLFTNFAAGWFATIVIFPGIWREFTFDQILLFLPLHFLYGILSLGIAFHLKDKSHEKL